LRNKKEGKNENNESLSFRAKHPTMHTTMPNNDDDFAKAINEIK
jgi:hypothetical protein